MTSAFGAHPRPDGDETDNLLGDAVDSAGEESDEDEEVAMNCIGGFRGIEDSDMNTTDSSSDEDEDDLDDDE